MVRGEILLFLCSARIGQSGLSGEGSPVAVFLSIPDFCMITTYLSFPSVAGFKENTQQYNYEYTVDF